MRRQQEVGVPLDLNPIQRCLLWVFNGVVAFFVVGVGIHAVVAGALARDVLQAALGVGIIAVVVVTIANLREAGRGVLTERGITLLGFFGRTRHMQWSEIERTEQGSVGARPQSVPVLSVYARGKKQPWIFGRAMANVAIVARAASLAEHGRPEASAALIREYARPLPKLRTRYAPTMAFVAAMCLPLAVYLYADEVSRGAARDLPAQGDSTSNERLLEIVQDRWVDERQRCMALDRLAARHLDERSFDAAAHVCRHGDDLDCAQRRSCLSAAHLSAAKASLEAGDPGDAVSRLTEHLGEPQTLREYELWFAALGEDERHDESTTIATACAERYREGSALHRLCTDTLARLGER